MTLALRLFRAPPRTAPALPVFAGGGRERVLTVLRHPAARRMRLAVDPCDGTVRLTLPRRAALGAALAWAESQRDWIERGLDALPPARPFRPGAAVPLEGRDHAILWAADGPRAVRREADAIRIGGPAELLPARLHRWLRAESLRRLEVDTREIAGAAGIAVGRVAVGDPRGRWGSCTGGGDIRYSWRLLLAPPEVRRATVAHEVAHRLHMHHGPAFHAAVRDLLGHDPAPERAWLRRHGAALHWVGRED